MVNFFSKIVKQMQRMMSVQQKYFAEHNEAANHYMSKKIIGTLLVIKMNIFT